MAILIQHRRFLCEKKTVWKNGDPDRMIEWSQPSKDGKLVKDIGITWKNHVELVITCSFQCMVILGKSTKDFVMIEWAPLGNDNGIISRLPIHLFMISHCMPTIFWLMFADKPIYSIAMMETYWCHWRASHQYLILTLSHNEWSSHNIQYFIYIYIHFVNLLYIYIYQEDYILMLLQ